MERTHGKAPSSPLPSLLHPTPSTVHQSWAQWSPQYPHSTLLSKGKPPYPSPGCPTGSLAGPGLGGVEVSQVFLQGLLAGEPADEASLLDGLEGLLASLGRVAPLLLQAHEGPAQPVLVLRLALQVLQRVALHLPGDGAGPPVLADPLLARDALPQQGQGEEHGGGGVGCYWFLALVSKQLQLRVAVRTGENRDCYIN